MNGGHSIKAVLLSGVTPNTRGLYLPKRLVQDLLGSKECVFEIKVKGRSVFKKYNPGLEEETRGYRFEVPLWVGKIDEEVEVSIRKISTIDFLRAADEAGLPFKISLKPGGRVFLIFEGGEVEVSVLGEVGWQGGSLNKPYLELALRDAEGEKHVFKIAYDGYSKPYAGIGIAGRAREVYSVRRVQNSLEVVYGLKYKSGVKRFSKTIRLEQIDRTIQRR